MKYCFAITFLLFLNAAIGQLKTFGDTAINVKVPYSPAKLLLFCDTTLIAVLDSTDNRKLYQFQKLDSGQYYIYLQKDLKKKNVLQGIVLKHETNLEINIENIGPCLFDHPKNYKPKCPMGHYNNIIPVLYGLPSPEDFKKANQGKVFLAGCTEFLDCSPHYYCTVHKISF